eukprot:gnl/Spiro4/11853_TR6255_c0_g1_i1.p1 gnl/Spiro4/11853_TR6255_c0_g1~~gnl/Spiro4/11853_TR6255_c0_g1_i1.p1  ORF type:complete len:753 (-),score=171.46 gnl/Spiro4/11853_TR6255_c0_g1_i1:44-2206(-)
MAVERLNGAEMRPLGLESVIGFEGKLAPSSLWLHPDRQHQIYPLGTTVVIRSVTNPGAQRFLQGHTDSVTCVAVSPCGRFIASGQRNAFGFPADVIVWSYSELRPLHQLKLHITKVQAVTFSHDGEYLVTMGGDGDKRIACWESQTGYAVCAASMPMPGSNTVVFFNTRSDVFVTGGQHGLLFWEIDRVNRKMGFDLSTTGQLKRVINHIVVAPDDEYVYCASTSGDVFQILVRTRTLKLSGPRQLFQQGVLTLCATDCRDEILVGGGDGTYVLMRSDTFRVLRTGRVHSAVTSITRVDCNGNFHIGTSDSSVFKVDFNTLQPTLSNSCHHGPINDVSFPHGFSALFVTCGLNEIRVWNIRNCTEIFRITEQKTKAVLTCLCVVITKDGRSILSGWDDGKVRAYSPETGRPLWIIHDAHPSGVTALCPSNDCSFLMTGGADGMVRSWRLGSASQSLVASMKEHRGRVNCIRIRSNDQQCVSASDDGSCVIWNISEALRFNILTASTFFRAVCYHPDESQLLTAGTDRKITFWDNFDGSAIRILDGSNDEIYGLDLTQNGSCFVSGGADRRVRVWDYETATPLYCGIGHSGNVNRVQISPDQRHIVSVGSEGAIFIWRMPELNAAAPPVCEPATVSQPNEQGSRGGAPASRTGPNAANGTGRAAAAAAPPAAAARAGSSHRSGSRTSAPPAAGSPRAPSAPSRGGGGGSRASSGRGGGSRR